MNTIFCFIIKTIYIRFLQYINIYKIIIFTISKISLNLLEYNNIKSTILSLLCCLVLILLLYRKSISTNNGPSSNNCFSVKNSSLFSSKCFYNINLKILHNFQYYNYPHIYSNLYNQF